MQNLSEERSSFYDNNFRRRVKMKLILQRKLQSVGYAIGELSVDGVFECFTLEDEVRPLGEKVKGSTAVPEGSYRVVVDTSQRFGRLMPHILDVPGFEGVRIHTGDTAADTEGCPLVAEGAQDNAPKTESSFAALPSKPAFDRLFEKLKAAKEVTIEIRNMPSFTPNAPAAQAAKLLPPQTKPFLDLLTLLLGFFKR